MKIGIYPGSFDPFHVGHNNIYWKAKGIFDKIIVARGINPVKRIRPLKCELPKHIYTMTYDGILTDFLRNLQVKNVNGPQELIVVRGFRNNNDINSQLEQDHFLKQNYSQFKSIYIKCDDEFNYVSSTAIKQLKELKQPYKHLII